MVKTFARIKSPYMVCWVMMVALCTIYLFSLCPTVYLIDSGELATVSYALGIAHPTGYPLYTLLSHFLAHLPGEPIVYLNLLSALFSVVAAMIMFFFALRITGNTIAAIIPVFVFACAPTIWRISVTNEVYPLTALFCCLILFSVATTRTSRHALFIAYVIGLAFTNHIIIFSIAIPVVAYMLLTYKPDAKKVIASIILGAIGISMYLYLIARTAAGTEFSWGNTINLQRLLWHITGKQYQVWMFSLSFGEIMNNLKTAVLFLGRDFAYVLLVLVFIGMYHLYTRNKKLLWLYVGIIVLNILYTINYSIPDVESYYIPSFVALVVLSAYGLKHMIHRIKWYAVLAVVVVLPIINYHACTLRDNTFGLDFAGMHIEQLPKRSLVLCTYWDIYSPILYLNTVKGIRSDLIVIDKELLRRTWYISYLKTRYPRFMRAAENRVEAFLSELYKFEYDRPYDPATIQLRYIAMLDAFVDNTEVEHVFLAAPVPDNDLRQVKPQLLRLPRGMVYELRPDTVGYTAFDYSQLSIEPPPVINDNRLKNNIRMVQHMTRLNILFLEEINRQAAAATTQKWLEEFNNSVIVP
jgi:hypothetical protein